ncbi:hypothetical protein ACO0QE_004253 [Hanseniaspora vineae]
MNESYQELVHGANIFFDSFSKLHNGNGNVVEKLNVGINTVLYFTLDIGNKSSNVEGIKNIPCDTTAANAQHQLCLITFQHEHINSGETDSMIYGYWLPLVEFSLQNNLEGKKINYGFTYSAQVEKFVPYVIPDADNANKRLAQVAPHMVSYDNAETIEKHHIWTALTSDIGTKLLKSIVGETQAILFPEFEPSVVDNFVYYHVDTSMTTKEEELQWNHLIDKKSNASFLQNKQAFNENRQLSYTYIKFKSLEAIRNSHKMEDYMDKTYYLRKIISSTDNGKNLLGELQLSYLIMCGVGSYGSALQWHNLIELFQLSSQLEQCIDVPHFYKILRLQLKYLPNEYKEVFLNVETFQRCFYHCPFSHPGLKTVNRVLNNELLAQREQGSYTNDREEGEIAKIVEINEDNNVLGGNNDEDLVSINHTSSEGEDYVDDDSDSFDNCRGYTVASKIIYRKV